MPSLPPTTPFLVVDDSPAVRARMVEYLHRLGYERVEPAPDIATGLDHFRKMPDDAIVFLDLVVGEEDGTDFAATALEERPMADVVLLTALPPSHERVTIAISQGAQFVLSKPVQFASLRDVIGRLAEARGTAPSPVGRDVSYR